MSKARELAELSRTVSDSADAVALTIDSSENVTFANDITVTGVITGTVATFTTADNESQLTLKSTDADADVGPVLDLTRDSGSPADGDAIGRIRYRFDNDNGDEETAIFLDGTLTDASDGTEDASFKIQTKVAGTARNRIDITSSEVVFNEDSQDLNFRIESNGSTKKFFVDGGENVVCINTDAPRGIAATSNRQFQMEGTSGVSSSFSITRNQNSNGGPGLFFGKTRGTSFGAVTIAQDGDSLGVVSFSAADGVDVAHQSAKIVGSLDGASAENDVPGRLEFHTTPDGSATLTEAMRINDSGDLLINTTTDYGGKVNIRNDQSASDTSALALISTLDSAADGPILDFIRDSASPATTDDIAVINFKADDSAGNRDIYAQIAVFSPGVTSGSEQGRIKFNTNDGSAGLRNRVDITTGETVFNQDSHDLDFRVETNSSANKFFVDGGNNAVLIGTNTAVTAYTTAPLQVSGTTNTTSALSIARFSNNANAPVLNFIKSRNTTIGGNTSVNAGDNLGSILFSGNDGTDSASSAARILGEVDGTPGSNDMPGRLTFSTTPDGSTSLGEAMRITDNGDVLIGQTSQSAADTGIIIQGPTGNIFATADGGAALYLRRLNPSNGEIARFSAGSQTAGSINAYSTSGGFLSISGGGGSNELLFPLNSTPPRIQPSADNSFDIGTASKRFDDVFSTGGINTSDRNEKQDIEDLSDAEKRVAVACKALIKKFRWKSSVAEKGDDARIHVGIMAQDLRDAFTAEGLDPARYSMWCSDTWTDETSGEEVTRQSVRYNELFAFIISAI